MELSPIVLFTYNRLWHTQQTVEALKANPLAKKSLLIVFSDGPCERRDNDISKVCEVRKYLHNLNGFQSVRIFEHSKNQGLANSIIGGVTSVIHEFGRIIVLEDDMVTSPFFLNYMNEALQLYQNEEDVVSIHGYIYPIKKRLPETFFLRGADCWGWGTWKRGWDLFNSNGFDLLSQIKERNLVTQFNFGGAYDYLGMLEKQIEGTNNSWAIRWYASAFLKNKYTLYPGRSLVKNIGLDNTGTHCDDDTVYLSAATKRPIKLSKIPVKQNEQAYQAFSDFFLNPHNSSKSWLSRIQNFIQRQAK